MHILRIGSLLLLGALAAAYLHAPEGSMPRLDPAQVASLKEAAFRTYETARLGLEQGWHRTPAIVAGILSLLAVPALAFAALAFRPVARVARRVGRSSRAAADSRTPKTSRLAPAWIELDGGQRRIALRREMMRIGRDPENDLALADRTLDGVHAVIHRTPESDFVIIDMSSGVGPGVAVNGQRLARTALSNGDRIVLGNCAMTFHRALSREPARRMSASTLTH